MVYANVCLQTEPPALPQLLSICLYSLHWSPVVFSSLPRDCLYAVSFLIVLLNTVYKPKQNTFSQAFWVYMQTVSWVFTPLDVYHYWSESLALLSLHFIDLSQSFLGKHLLFYYPWAWWTGLFFIINGNSVAVLEFLHVENIKQALAAIKSELLIHLTGWMDLILNALSNCVELFSQLI